MNRKNLIINNVDTEENNESLKVKSKEYKFKRFGGITLISLVITIILLIMLAGVAINLSIGENGLFNKAKMAKENYLLSANQEQSNLANINIDSYINEITSFKKLLEYCGINASYTIKELAQNKDGILEKVLTNKNAVNYIISNPNEFLDEFINSEIALEKISTVGNIKEKIINNEVWLTGIQNSANVEVFDNNMKTIPIMTSNNTPSGEVLANGYDSRGYYPYYAFDRDDTTYFYNYPVNNQNLDCSLIYKFNEEKLIYKIQVNIQNPASNRYNNSFKIFISSYDSGETWKEIKSDEWYSSGFGLKTETVTLEKSEKIKRIKFYSYNASGCTHIIHEAQAYGI